MNSNSKNKPPLFHSWIAWYVILLALLAVEIILFYLLTIRYS